MEKSRKSFVFNAVWYEIIADCSAQVKGEVFAAVMEYALFGKTPQNICNEANVIFQFIKIEIDRREKRRQRTIAAKALMEYFKLPENAQIPEVIEYSENSEKTSQQPLSRQQRRQMERDAKKKLKKGVR